MTESELLKNLRNVILSCEDENYKNEHAPILKDWLLLTIHSMDDDAIVYFAEIVLVWLESYVKSQKHLLNEQG